MCPACATTAATIVAGVTSASGVTALVVKIRSVKRAVEETLRLLAIIGGK